VKRFHELQRNRFYPRYLWQKGLFFQNTYGTVCKPMHFSFLFRFWCFTVFSSILSSSFAFAGNLIIVRHGLAENNVQKVFNSRLDSQPAPLTEAGRDQAKKAAAEIKNQLIDKSRARVIHSPLARTAQTAEIIRQDLGLAPSQVSEDPLLIEVDHGDLEGLPYSACEVYTPDPWDLSAADLYHGETEQELERRMANFLSKAMGETSEDEDLVIITHGNPAKYLLRKVDPALETRLPNCGFRVIDRKSIKKFEVTGS
jgi:broad specificity phosphatase PhoE